MSENKEWEIVQHTSNTAIGALIPGAKIKIIPNIDENGKETGTVQIFVTCEKAVIPKGKLPAVILTNTQEREARNETTDRSSPRKNEPERRKKGKLKEFGKIIIPIGAAAVLLAAAIGVLKSCDGIEQIPTTPLSPTTVAETVAESFTIEGSIEEDFTVGGMFYYTPNPLNGDGVYEYNKEAFEFFQEDAQTVASAMGKLNEYSDGTPLSHEQINSLPDIAYNLCAGYYGQFEYDLAGTIIPGIGDEPLLDANIDGVLYQQGVANSNFERANQLYMGAQVIEQAINNGAGPEKGIDTTSVDASVTFKGDDTTRDAQVYLDGNIVSGFSEDVGTMENAVKEIEDILAKYAPYTKQISVEFTITDSEGNRVERRYYNGSKEEVLQSFQEDFESYYGENTVESGPQLRDQRVITGNEVSEVAGTQTRLGLRAALAKFGKLFSRGENER